MQPSRSALRHLLVPLLPLSALSLPRRPPVDTTPQALADLTTSTQPRRLAETYRQPRCATLVRLHQSSYLALHPARQTRPRLLTVQPITRLVLQAPLVLPVPERLLFLLRTLSQLAVHSPPVQQLATSSMVAIPPSLARKSSRLRTRMATRSPTPRSQQARPRRLQRVQHQRRLWAL